MRWLALMGAVAALSCGRLGYGELGAGAGGDADPDVIDADPVADTGKTLPDANDDVADASGEPDGMSMIDAGPMMCVDMGSVCPNKTLDILTGQIPVIDEAAAGFGDNFLMGPGCIAPTLDDDYTILFTIEDPGNYAVGVLGSSIWYLLQGNCGGTQIACSSLGGTQLIALSAATEYTLVVEESGGTGTCARFQGSIAGPM